MTAQDARLVNPLVAEEAIWDRFAAKSRSPVLVILDMTEFSFTLENVGSDGMLKKLTVGYAGEYHTPR
jgi:hypothetical protein